VKVPGVLRGEEQGFTQGLANALLVPELQVAYRNTYGELALPVIPMDIGFASPANTLVGCIDVGCKAYQVSRPVLHSSQQGAGGALNS
jgi:hypothetical protein